MNPVDHAPLTIDLVRFRAVVTCDHPNTLFAALVTSVT